MQSNTEKIRRTRRREDDVLHRDIQVKTERRDREIKRGLKRGAPDEVSHERQGRKG